MDGWEDQGFLRVKERVEWGACISGVYKIG